MNQLVEEASTVDQRDAGQQPNTTDSTGGGSAPAGEPVLVTFYIDLEQLAAVQQYLEDNDVFIRNVGEDWIEAHVPPALLPAAFERPGVRRVDTVIPPQPQSLGSVVSQGVELHQADAWHRMGFRGQRRYLYRESDRPKDVALLQEYLKPVEVYEKRPPRCRAAGNQRRQVPDAVRMRLYAVQRGIYSGAFMYI